MSVKSYIVLQYLCFLINKLNIPLVHCGSALLQPLVCCHFGMQHFQGTWIVLFEKISKELPDISQNKLIILSNITRRLDLIFHSVDIKTKNSITSHFCRKFLQWWTISLFRKFSENFSRNLEFFSKATFYSNYNSLETQTYGYYALKDPSGLFD